MTAATSASIKAVRFSDGKGAVIDSYRTQSNHSNDIYG
jgi:hypothetical protein